MNYVIAWLLCIALTFVFWKNATALEKDRMLLGDVQVTIFLFIAWILGVFGGVL